MSQNLKLHSTQAMKSLLSPSWPIVCPVPTDKLHWIKLVNLQITTSSLHCQNCQNFPNSVIHQQLSFLQWIVLSPINCPFNNEVSSQWCIVQRYIFTTNKWCDQQKTLPFNFPVVLRSTYQPLYNQLTAAEQCILPIIALYFFTDPYNSNASQ